MEGTKQIDTLMIPVMAAIKRHISSRDAVTDIYNRAYEAVMIGIEAQLRIPVSERMPDVKNIVSDNNEGQTVCRN